MVTTAGSPASLRLAKLLRHVEDVRRDCETMGEALIARGEFDLGKTLIAQGRIHDASKFTGLEWDHLGDPNPELHRSAWARHVAHNAHHPEFWGGIHRMEAVYAYEMVADWHSRASEFGTDLRLWIAETAMPRFEFGHQSPVWGLIADALGLLLEPSFP